MITRTLISLAPSLLLRSLRKHIAAVSLLILEIAIAMAILSNIANIVLITRAHASSTLQLDDSRLTIVQNIGVIGSDSPSGSTGAALQALRTLPGVEHAAFGPAPLTASRGPIRTTVEQEAPNAEPFIYFGSQGLSAALGLQLEQGSALDDSMLPDIEAALGSNGSVPIPVLLTASLARHLFPDRNAIGQNLHTQLWGNYPAKLKIVGIVSNFRSAIDSSETEHHALIAEARITSQALGGLYLIRTRTSPSLAHIEAISRTLSSSMPGFVQQEPKTLQMVRNEHLSNRLARAHILTAIAIIVTVSAALGIFGLTNYWVARRRRSIGIRRALGATRLNIASYFLMENAVIAMTGILFGSAIAMLANALLVSKFGVPFLHPKILISSGIAVSLICVTAALLPALRATWVQPSLAAQS